MIRRRWKTSKLIRLVLESLVMPSSTVAILRSIRRWVLIIAFLMGLGVIALAATGYEVGGAQEGTLFAVVGASGGVVALIAILALLWGLVTPRTNTADPSRDADQTE
jgi:membrane associated rhomboid family serine protease